MSEKQKREFTPGGWWASGLEVGTVPMMMVKVARVSGGDYTEAKANAQLISATPDLLDAVEGLLGEYDSDGLEANDAVIVAKAAIRKALWTK